MLLGYGRLARRSDPPRLPWPGWWEVASHRSTGNFNSTSTRRHKPFLTFSPQNPRQYKIPDWFLNRQRDIKDGKTNQVGSFT